MGLANWMSYYPNNYLSELSIPGSHDSASWKTEMPIIKFLPAMGLLAVTQAGSITDQLNNGVRFLDIRIRSVGDNLYAYHGGTPQVPLRTVLSSIKQFLTQNQSEGVIVNLQEDSSFELSQAFAKFICSTLQSKDCDEIDNSSGPVTINATGVDSEDTQFLQRIKGSWYLNPSDGNLNRNLNRDLNDYKPPSGYYTNNEIPRVKDIQGKAMLITSQSGIKNGVENVTVDWRGGYSNTISLDNGTSLQTQNNWTLQPDKKITLVRNTMRTAWHDNTKKLYLNFASTAPQSSIGLPTPPLISSSIINKNLNSLLSKTPPYSKLGIIAYDFVTNPLNISPSKLALATINSNKNYSKYSENILLKRDSDSNCETTNGLRNPGKLITKCSDTQDKIIGTNNSESIRASKGNDFINPGNGDDTISGGKGIDSFVISQGEDVIKDFRAGEFLLIANDRFDDVKLRQKGDDLLIKIKNYSSTLLLDQKLKDFDASCIIPASGLSLI